MFLFKRALNFVDLIFRLYFNISCYKICNIWAYRKKILGINSDITISFITITNVSVNIKHPRGSRPEVFLIKGALKICSKFTGESPCRSVISIKLLCIFIEITRRHGCSPVNLPHIFRTPFLKNTSGRLLLDFECRTPYTGAMSDK